MAACGPRCRSRRPRVLGGSYWTLMDIEPLKQLRGCREHRSTVFFPSVSWVIHGSVQAMVSSTPCRTSSFCIGYCDVERNKDATCQALPIGLRGGSDMQRHPHRAGKREARCQNFAAAYLAGGSQVLFSHLICGDCHCGNLTARSVSQFFP